MKRNPLAAVASAIRSLFKAQPKPRTVEIPTPAIPGEGMNRARLRRHSKHSAASLPHRRHWRPARRAALSLRLSRVMAQVSHPLAALAMRAPEAMNPKLTGDARKRWARRWARNQLKAKRAAVSR